MARKNAAVEDMTPEERRAEIVKILATGVLRLMRQRAEKALKYPASGAPASSQDRQPLDTGDVKG